MADDDIQKLLEARLRGDAPKLAGDTTKRKLLDASPGAAREAADEMRTRAAQDQEAPLRVYMVFDTTGSMYRHIQRVQECIDHVGREIFESEKGIEASVIGVSEHIQTPTGRMRDYFISLGGSRRGFRGRFLDAPGVKVIGDFGQDNTPTNSVAELHRQIYAIVPETEPNMDGHEAYECIAAHLVEDIRRDKEESSPDKQYAVVFFGDSGPHLKPRVPDNKLRAGEWDLGCPHSRGAEQLVVLASTADHSYWVGCNKRSGYFEEATYGYVAQQHNTTFVGMRDAQQVLPQLLVGMVKQVRGGDEGLAEYVRTLEGRGQKQVAGKVRLLLTDKTR